MTANLEGGPGMDPLVWQAHGALMQVGSEDAALATCAGFTLQARVHRTSFVACSAAHHAEHHSGLGA